MNTLPARQYSAPPGVLERGRQGAVAGDFSVLSVICGVTAKSGTICLECQNRPKPANWEGPPPLAVTAMLWWSPSSGQADARDTICDFSLNTRFLTFRRPVAAPAPGESPL